MRNRNRVIVVHLDNREYESLNQKCRQAGLRREQFVRAVLDGAEVKARPPDSYKTLVREIAAVGNNLNQIAHLANSRGHVSNEQIERAAAILSRVWEYMQKNA